MSEAFAHPPAQPSAPLPASMSAAANGAARFHTTSPSQPQPQPQPSAIPPQWGAYPMPTQPTQPPPPIPGSALGSPAIPPGAAPADALRVMPLVPMAGPEGAQVSVRVTFPAHLLDQRPMPNDPQFHFVFGNYLFPAHLNYEQPPVPGLASLILFTNAPTLADVPQLNPDNVPLRIQFRPPGTRNTTLYNVGAYQIFGKAPPQQFRHHPAELKGPPPGSELWNNVGGAPAPSQYGPMRTASGGMPGAQRMYDQNSPYMRARYSDHAPPPRPASPGRVAVAPRPMMSGPPLTAPALVRAPQSNPSHDGSFVADPMSNRPRAQLKLQGDLSSMAYGWTVDELQEGRRLVQFWRKQEGTTIHATFRPIMMDQYVKNSIVVSCIFRADRNECYITSVDTILLLEALVASRFSIEEKNRIRRNLEGFHPETVRKHSGGSEDFFKRIMNFKDPKPRTIAKDVKTFSWKVLEHALCKVIEKYVGDVPPEVSPVHHGGGGGMPLAPPSRAMDSMHFLPAAPQAASLQ